MMMEAQQTFVENDSLIAEVSFTIGDMQTQDE